MCFGAKVRKRNEFLYKVILIFQVRAPLMSLLPKDSSRSARVASLGYGSDKCWWCLFHEDEVDGGDEADERRDMVPVECLSLE